MTPEMAAPPGAETGGDQMEPTAQEKRCLDSSESAALFVPVLDSHSENATYAKAAPEYFARGWQPLPLFSGKGVTPPGSTGYAGAPATKADVERWGHSKGVSGLCLRLVDMVGLDVDSYHPDCEWEALVAKHGALPHTWRSTSRLGAGYDGTAGIRLYRLPQKYAARQREQVWCSVLGKHVDVVRFAHRQVNAWPTMHKRGTRYQWLDEATGEIVDGPLPVRPEDIPELPEAWAEALLKPEHPQSAKQDRIRKTVATTTPEERAEVESWWTPGEPCPAVEKALVDILERLPGNRHDTAVPGMLQLTRLGEQGHQGVHDAVTELQDAFIAELDGDPSRTEAPEDEWSRAEAGIHAQIAAKGFTNPENRGCCVSRKDFSGDNWGEGDTAEPAADDDPPTWAPVDLSQFLDGSYVQPTPTLFPRSDGVCLVYPGLTHSFHGESESGKSLIALVLAVWLIMSGKRVLFVDFESDAASIVGRLLEFGASSAAIKDWFVYIRPEVSPRAGRERDAWLEVLTGTFTLAIVDGVTDSLGLFGFSTKENDDITAWAHLLPRRIADRTGAAVIQIDHVTKDSDSRGRFAIGGQAKMSGLTGSAYTVEVVTGHPLGRGLRGVVVLRVAKDRPGFVRQHGGTMRADRTQEVARITVDSTGAHPVVTVEPWQGFSAAGEPSEFRPTYLMEALSRALEKAGEPLSFRSLDELVHGKATHKRTALGVLRDEGYITITDGPRGSHLHASKKTYRQIADPASDEYVALPDLGDTVGQL